MINELEHKKIRLKINIKKTKVIFNWNVPKLEIEVEYETCEWLQNYVYLCQTV